MFPPCHKRTIFLSVFRKNYIRYLFFRTSLPTCLAKMFRMRELCVCFRDLLRPHIQHVFTAVYIRKLGLQCRKAMAAQLFFPSIILSSLFQDVVYHTLKYVVIDCYLDVCACKFWMISIMTVVLLRLCFNSFVTCHLSPKKDVQNAAGCQFEPLLHLLCIFSPESSPRLLSL